MTESELAVTWFINDSNREIMWIQYLNFGCNKRLGSSIRHAVTLFYSAVWRIKLHYSASIQVIFFYVRTVQWWINSLCKAQDVTVIRSGPLNVVFDILLTAHLSIFISIFNQLDAQNLFHNKFYFMPLHVSSACAHHQVVKIALHSL
jgi:hypothetical protein